MSACADSGRESTLACNGVQQLSEVLAGLVEYTDDDLELVRAACGCCLNLMTGHGE